MTTLEIETHRQNNRPHLLLQGRKAERKDCLTESSTIEVGESGLVSAVLPEQAKETQMHGFMARTLVP